VYDHIRGTLVGAGAGGRVVLEAGGVGYALRASAATLAALPAAGTECRLFVRLLVREDALALHGFATELERSVFDLLLGATGVGPVVALSLLSARGPAGVLRAIRDEEPAALSGAKGVGEKLARRIVLELRKRAAELALEVPEAERAAPAGPREDAVKALVALEWTRAEAERAVGAVLAESPGLAEAGAILQRALRGR
jgi:Holliday junction DNA helicase RuvA